MEDILARLRLNDSRKTSATHVELAAGSKLSDQVTKTTKQEKGMRNSDSDNLRSTDTSSASSVYTPATTSSYGMMYNNASESSNGAKVGTTELNRIKRELAAAQSVINRQEQELAETRSLKHTMDQVMGPASEVDFGSNHEISEQTIGHLQSAFNASARPFTSRSTNWSSQDDSRSEQSGFSVGSFPDSRGIWNHQSMLGVNGLTDMGAGNSRDARLSGQAYAGIYGNQGPAGQPFNGRSFSNSSAASLGYDPRLADPQLLGTNLGTAGFRRGGHFSARSGSAMSDALPAFGNLSTVAGLGSPPLSPMDMQSQFGFQARGLGLEPSALPPNFPGSLPPSAGGQWGLGVSHSDNLESQSLTMLQPSADNGQTYVTPLEPMNYRRLLDKSVSCDWKYIVDKIVCNNDQQASIFLQQKLKVGTAEQKFDIVESIVNQAYPLMINRFGNFLVQRCFEHGTPEQVVAIADAIQGNVIALSMDPFGCHVIQKAFDSVPETHKANMVKELLRRIPDTVIHRYACHVWQKLFELRWSGEPPQIMLKVNEALRGMWHEVALGETGSLVVQNIFENCVEDEKRPAIEEVISNIDLIAHGQFGNWCIQHLCEHGSPPDKRRVIDHILTNSYNYSIDQFASKVVEKCLKIGGVEFLDKYLSVITTARPDRPRIPLIDIAGDQYGNYLIQWILMNAHHHQKEQVAVHIRKHMVSLRGSKFGSRVAMLCCNPNAITRPGPGAMVSPYGATGQPRAQWARYR